MRVRHAVPRLRRAIMKHIAGKQVQILRMPREERILQTRTKRWPPANVHPQVATAGVVAVVSAEGLLAVAQT